MTTVEYKDQSCRLLALTDEVDKQGVTSLRLTNVRLEGSESELACFGMMFRGHPDLKELYLKNVTLSQDEMNLDQALSCLLVSADHIETVHIENAPITTSSLMTVSYCSTLRNLILPNNRFVDKDAAALADALSSSKDIRKVDLSGNDISDVGAKSLEACLESNSSLVELCLTGNSAMSQGEFGKIEAKLQGRAAMAA